MNERPVPVQYAYPPAAPDTDQDQLPQTQISLSLSFKPLIPTVKLKPYNMSHVKMQSHTKLEVGISYDTASGSQREIITKRQRDK